MAQEVVSERPQDGRVQLQYAQISQRHARITFRGGGAVVDFGSKRDLRPVRVVKDGKEESIVYHAKLMEEGKPYVVELYGERFALIKKGDTIKMVEEDEV